MLEVELVEARYRSKKALSQIRCSFDPGWTSIVGPNGSGKSTLLKSLLGQVSMKGVIRWNDRALSRSHRRDIYSYLPQHLERPKGMSVFEYVMLGRTAKLGWWQSAANSDRDLVCETLELVGARKLMNRSVVTLSGGEMQRVGFARCLAQQAPVVLLDEFNASLDIGAVVAQCKLQAKLTKSRNLTVISAIHDLNLAARFSDRVILLNDGEVVASGTPLEVLKPDLLSQVFDAQIEVASREDGTIDIYVR